MNHDTDHKRALSSALNQLKPIARSSFMNTLEKQLTAEFNTQSLNREGRRHFVFPLTLIAALVAIVFAGSALILLSTEPILPGMIAAQATALTTPTTPSTVAFPAHFEPVIIAVRRLPLGTSISTEDVAVVFFPESVVPENTYDELSEVVDSAVGRDVERWQPITTNDMQTDAVSLLPIDQVIVSIEVDSGLTAHLNIGEGDKLDVFAGMMFIDVDENFQRRSETSVNILPLTEIQTAIPELIPAPDGTCTVIRPCRTIQRLVSNATLIQITNLSDQVELSHLITLSVPAQDAIKLAWAIEAKLPLTIRPANTSFDEDAIEAELFPTLQATRKEN